MKRFLSTRYLSIKYAFSGVGYVLRTQKNTWIYVVTTFLLVVTMALLNMSPVELSLLIIAICVVWVAEFINTIIETLVDLVSPNYSLKAKVIKDVSAATVLVMAIMAALVGIIIIIPNICDRYQIGFYWSR